MMLRLVLILLSLLFVSPSWADYTMPIGIPAPAWGGSVGNPIDLVAPSRPSPWTSAIAGYYYIDRDEAGATDSGRTYGYPGAARMTIPSTLGAGVYVEVHGTYTYAPAGYSVVTGSGTNDAWVAATSGPVWITGQDTNTRPSITRKIILFGSYVFMQFCNLTESGRVQFGGGTGNVDHCMVRNCDMQSTTTTAGGVSITSSNTGATTTSNITVYNNNIHDLGDMETTEDQDYNAILVDYWSSYVWLLNNTMYNTSGTAVQVGASISSANYANLHHIYCGLNLAYNTRQGGFWIKRANHVIFSQNTAHDTVEMSWSGNKGLGGQYKPTNAWYIYNTVYNCGRGIIFGSFDSDATGPVYLIGNVLYNLHHESIYDPTYDPADPYGEAAIFVWSAKDFYIIANTIYDSDAGIIITSAGATNSAVIENNIIFSRAESLARDIWINSKEPNIVVRNNLVYTSGGTRFGIGNTVHTTVADFETELNADATCSASGNISSDPLLVNPPTSMSIQSGSPAKETGLAAASLTVDVYATFLATYGVSIQYDYASTARPVGSWDMGAYEYAILTPSFSGVTITGGSVK